MSLRQARAPGPGVDVQGWGGRSILKYIKKNKKTKIHVDIKIYKLQVRSSKLLANIALPILDVVRGENVKVVLLPDFSALYTSRKFNLINLSNLF